MWLHGADAGTIDTAVDVAVPDMFVSTFCNPIDGLVACYEFENSTADATTNHLDATAVNVMYTGGKVGQALQIASNSAATVAASDKFDVAQLTIEAWIQPSALPTPTRIAVVLDVDNQYALWISETGR